MYNIYSRIRNAFYINRLIRRLKRLNPDDAPILEVGSGNNPLSVSDVLLDKYAFTTDIHRSGSGPIKQHHGKIFVLGDGNSLPFRDNAFGVVICRHVVEHVDDPNWFVAELQRVGVNGYLEWPSIVTELVSGGYGKQSAIRKLYSDIERPHLEALEHGVGTAGHRWYIFAENNKMYFLQKSRELYPMYLMFGRYAKSNALRLKRFLAEKFSWIVWTSETPVISVVVLAKTDCIVSESLEENYDIQEQISYLRESNLTNNSLSLASQDGVLQALLRCPLCRKGDLQEVNSSYTCSLCKEAFPIVNGIPILMTTGSE